MRYKEFMAESMPDKKTLAKLKQDAKELKAMSKTGNMDLNKAMPMMQDMARVAARSDMGSKFLGFMQKMASAIKKGIDTNMYSPKDLPMMQKAYDSIISQMPQLQKMASDSKALALKYGRTDREKASLDDKGNYKGTNITPTKQQSQRLAREAYDKKHGHDSNSHVVKHKDDNGKDYWGVYNHNKGKGGKIVKTFYSEKGASDFARKNHDALMSDKMKANEDMNAIVAKQGKKKHGQKYMDAARAMAQEKGRKLTPDERDKLRNKHSDNRKEANETISSSSVASVAQNMNSGNIISRNMYNKNGTMKNGLDYGNILGGPSKPKKIKKRRV